MRVRARGYKGPWAVPRRQRGKCLPADETRREGQRRLPRDAVEMNQRRGLTGFPSVCAGSQTERTISQMEKRPYDFTVYRVHADLDGAGSVRAMLTDVRFGSVRARYDLRRWAVVDGQPVQPLKGVGLTLDETVRLRDTLNALDLGAEGDQA